jgi:signal transduction histidine kinase
VLAVALILFSVGLYIGVSYMLFTPIRSVLADRASFESMQWQHFPDTPCGNPNFRPDNGPPPTHIYDNPIVACFNQQGVLIQADTSQQIPFSFLTNNLVSNVLHSGPTFDTIYGNSSTGDIYRYALPVPNPYGQGILGVVQVGIPVAQQETALHVLLLVQLTLGLLVLIGAAFGGLFLANRALAPTRLAFEHQQRFIGDASHELRTPLTLLRADAEVLLRGRTHLPPDDVALLEDIVSETSHMSTLATNMLVLARLDTMPQHLEQDIVDLNSVVNNVIRRTAALAEQMNITLHTEHADSPIILGDAVLLEQALLILLDNAIKYNHQNGSVTIRTNVQRERAILEVQDTGIGIDAEHLEHLGERFYRVDKARSREAGGTGLGLSIARSIITTHQGILTLQSTPGEGTTVTLNLPCIKTHHKE